MTAVCDHRSELADAFPAVITFADDPAWLAAYRSHLGIDVPVLADVDRALYRTFGAGRGSFRRVWSPGTLMMYARLLRRGRRGRRVQSTTEDTQQLGADAVIDREGRLHRLWLPDSPDGHGDARRLAQTTHAYPSWSMAIQQVALQFFGPSAGLRARPVTAAIVPPG